MFVKKFTTAGVKPETWILVNECSNKLKTLSPEQISSTD